MFKYLLPTMMFCALIPLSAQANSNSFTLLEAQTCTSLSSRIDDREGSVAYYEGLTEEALKNAEYWYSQNNARLYNHFYDNAEHFNNERNHFNREMFALIDQYNARCANGSISQEVYHQACQGREENFFCRSARY